MMDIGRPNLDWVKLANGTGVEAARANSVREFAACFNDALQSRGPRLVEAVL
jgi:acetolactate synthase-1/2/3 large subunit